MIINLINLIVCAQSRQFGRTESEKIAFRRLIRQIVLLVVDADYHSMRDK
jgi:hypothetical protein